MKTALLAVVLITNLSWYIVYQERSDVLDRSTSVIKEYQTALHQCVADAKANDEAATECAVRTGYKFNCSDGTQSASCY